MSNRIRDTLEAGISERVFPSAQAVVLHRGQRVFDATVGDTRCETRFDLASLTKVICTTTLFMRAWATGKLGPETRVGRFFPDAKSAHVTIADLLCHRSGLPAFVPYFARVMPAVPELFNDDTPRRVWDEVRREILSAVFAASPRSQPGEHAVYSDVGFIQLGELLSRVFDQPLDDAFDQHVAAPLGLAARFRRISARAAATDIAPTGALRPREPAPGQEKLWEPFPQVPTRAGEVDDDNAWVLDGVAGHAGLFSTAMDVARFGQAVLEELGGKNAIAPAPLWQLALARDSRTPDSSRACGFDTPSKPSSAGRFIGNLMPGAVGHTGFTGTSLWIDLGRSLVVALVTNRVAYGRANQQMLSFRPRFHDAVVQALGLEVLS